MKRKAIDKIVEPITEKTNPEAWSQYQREQLEQKKVYALKMLDLQEEAVLTYKEARVFLNKRSIKILNHLAMEWGHHHRGSLQPVSKSNQKARYGRTKRNRDSRYK